MITPRTTRLVRTRDLDTFRQALIALASDGSPLEARDRLVIVPTRAAGSLLAAAVERARLGAVSAVVLPELITASELTARLAERAAPSITPTRDEAREILMGVACRAAAAEGHPPPFALRPGLVASALDFHDALTRRRRDTAGFERLVLGRLEPGAEYDRGAARLVRQTRFLAAAFVRYEDLCRQHGVVDDRALREAALSARAARPWRHVIVAVGDESADRYGLAAADWDVLTRIDGLDRLDVVVTDNALAGAWHEQVHAVLPGIDEVRFEAPFREPPTLRTAGSGAQGTPGRAAVNQRLWVSRDREEEVADFARWVREIRREQPDVPLDTVALVVRQPLPYTYLAREVLRSANVPCQTFDTLPLAGEPYSAALDLVFSAVSTGVSRAAGIALLRSPHFRWDTSGMVAPGSVAAADRVLSEHGYSGGAPSLERIVASSGADGASSRERRARPALHALLEAARDLEPLTETAPAAGHLERLLAFLAARSFDGPPELSMRVRRGKAAVVGILHALRDDFAAFDGEPVGFDRIVAIVRRRIEAHTFAPRVGDHGVHVIDADSARFGDFSFVQLAGLVEGEWPDRRQQSIFYGAAILADLGWPVESERTDHERAAFVDLLGLPRSVLTVSAFALEDDAPVTASPLAGELAGLEVATVTAEPSDCRVFEDDALAHAPVVLEGLAPAARDAALWRLVRPSGGDSRYHGFVSGRAVAAHSLSGLERYQDCPFRFFASDVLRLEEPPADDPFLTPRERGRFIHETLQRFFEAWDERGARNVTVERMIEARELFSRVAEPMLLQLDESDAMLERSRLFGSAISVGVVDVMLDLEASNLVPVTERWLEERFEGSFRLGGEVAVPLRGVADRVDLLEGRLLRVVDYKTGLAPPPARALQVPIYALCARERLEQRDHERWTVAEAHYLAFSGPRAVTPVLPPGVDADAVLADARQRLLGLTDSISKGEFPVRPHDVILCRSCPYPAVCRKDGVDGR